MDAQLTRLPQSIEIYEAAIEGLSRVNEVIYREYPNLPEIHTAGVVYRREAGEAWRHVDDVVGEGWGDCEDLAAARVGWLRAKRIDPKARVKIVRTGPKMTHAIVARGNGKLEDPSRELGMGTPDGYRVMHPLDQERDAPLMTMRGAYIGYDDDVSGPSDDELGWVPVAMLAAKYGPTVAKAAHKAYKNRKAKQKAKKAKARSAKARASAPVPAPEPESIDPTDDESIVESDEQDNEVEVIGADPSTSADLSWTVERTETGWRGVVRVPLDLGRCLFVTRSVDGKFPSMAVTKAAKAAAGVLDTPAAKSVPSRARSVLNLVRSPATRDLATSLLKAYRSK